jgi:hypothetical protein
MAGGIALKALAGLAGLVLAAAAAAYAANVPRQDGRGVPDVLDREARGTAGPGAGSIGSRPAPPLILTHPPAVGTSATAFFRFRAPRTASRSECRLDRRRWQTCGSSATYASIAFGRHLFRVRAVGTGRRSRSSRYAWQRIETKPFTVIPNLSGLEALYPGAAPIVLPLRIANPNPVPIVVTALRVAVARDPAGCESASNLELAQSDASSRTPLRIPVGGTVQVPSQGVLAPTIRLLDLPVNQDGCKNVSFPLSFSGTAHG